MEAEYKEFVINKKFAPLFKDTLQDPRYYQVYGGRGSGKSFGASVSAVIKCTSREFAHKILYLRQTMTSLEDSSIADVRAAIIALGLGHEFRENRGVVIHKKTGNTISFKGFKSSGNATAKLKSLSGITTLIIEEAEEVESFDEFSKVDESIRIKGIPLKIILIYNPTSSISSWIHKEWFNKGQPLMGRAEHDTEYLHSTYHDNIDNLAESVVQRYEDLATSDPIYYKNTILAEWTLDTVGRVYAGWDKYEVFKDRGDVWYGLDFGYGGKDKTALIEINYFDKTYYATEIFAIAGISISETVALMKKYGIPLNANIFADSAVPTLITEVRLGGFTGIKKATKGKVETGIKKIQDKNIVIVGDSPQLYYDYKTFSRGKKDELPHEPDTLAALRYGINSRTPINTRSDIGEAGKERRRQQQARRRRVRGDLN